jgi:hypothetical protein
MDSMTDRKIDNPWYHRQCMAYLFHPLNIKVLN